MTCREFAAFILDYSTGELAADARARFERHLRRCADCRAYLAQYLTAMRLGRRAFADGCTSAAAAGVPDDLVAAILAARRAP